MQKMCIEPLVLSDCKLCAISHTANPGPYYAKYWVNGQKNVS
jgi:hypothetical protein